MLAITRRKYQQLTWGGKYTCNISRIPGNCISEKSYLRPSWNEINPTAFRPRQALPPCFWKVRCSAKISAESCDYFELCAWQNFLEGCFPEGVEGRSEQTFSADSLSVYKATWCLFLHLGTKPGSQNTSHAHPQLAHQRHHLPAANIREHNKGLF